MPLVARLALATLCAAGATASHATCFTVVDGAERVVYQSTRAPFDVSQPISQELARHYSPRHHLLISARGYCPGIDQPSGVYGAPLPGSRIEGNVSPALRLADANASWTSTPPPAAAPGWVAASGSASRGR